MGLELDFTLTEQQKKTAVIGGIAALVLGVAVLWWFTRPVSYDEALDTLNKLRASNKTANAEDLKAMAPLLNHDDQKIKVEVMTYWNAASAADVNQVGQQAAQFSDPAVRRGVESFWAQKNPEQFVASAGPQAAATEDRHQRESLYNMIAQTAIPESLPLVERVLDQETDEGIKQSVALVIASKPEPFKSLAPKLQKIADDQRQSDRTRQHARQALHAMSRGGGPAAPYPDPRPRR